MPYQPRLSIDYDVFRDRLHSSYLDAREHAADGGLYTVRVLNGTKIYWRDMGGALTYLAFAPPKLVLPITAFFLDELQKLRNIQTRQLPSQVRSTAA